MPKPLKTICKEEILENWNYKLVKDNISLNDDDITKINILDESILKQLERYNIEQLLNFHKKLNSLIYKKDQENKKENKVDEFSSQAKSNRGKTTDKIFMDNIYNEWIVEINKLDLETSMLMIDKIEKIRDIDFNKFLLEHNKNPTISKVEFLKSFDIECFQHSTPELINS
jgi:hypothetical protein